MDKAIISVSNVDKKYRLFSSSKDRLKEAVNPFGKKYHKEFWALKNINFDIKRGEVIGILGKNGSGKSTLLQIISNIKNPTSGNVDVNGTVASILELGIDFNPELTGRENLILRGVMNGISEKEINSKLPEIIDFASIGEFIDQPVGLYSSGMLVRVAFASCISLSPDVFIVDEALSVGDLEFQIKCINWIREYVSKGGTLIFVSHDLQLLTSLCEKTILIEKGQIIAFEKTQICTELYIKKINEVNKKSDKEKYIDKKKKFDSLIAYGDVNADVKTLEITDQYMKPTNYFSYNDYCKVTMKIMVKPENMDAHMLFLLRDARGYNVYGKWIPINTLEAVKSGNNYIIDIALEFKLPLAEGAYGITISINKKQMHVTTSILERHVAAKYIHVSNSPSFMHGVVNL